MKLSHFKAAQRTLASALLIVSFFSSGVVKASSKEPSILQSSTSNSLVARSNLQGKFKVQHYPVEKPEYAKLEYIVKESEAFETLATALNETFIMPRDVTIKIGECGEANAFYSPRDHEIVMCYELMEVFANDFFKHVDSEAKLYEKVIYTTLFVFFHELGHALIGELDLPTTGKEEDAVDQLATIILTIAGSEAEEAEEIALAAAKQFELASAKQTDVRELAFWGEHSLDKQRYYTIVCLLYGSNPDKYTFLARQAELPENRAQRCEGEYVKTATSWLKLLAPYMREEAN